MNVNGLNVINVYDPPESDRHFFKSLFTTIASESERIVMRAGDFNVILHDKVDTSIKNNKTHLTKNSSSV